MTMFMTLHPLYKNSGERGFKRFKMKGMKREKRIKTFILELLG
jgi:hypothetical protein